MEVRLAGDHLGTVRQGGVHRRRQAPHRDLRRGPARLPRRAHDARHQGQPGLGRRRGWPVRPREGRRRRHPPVRGPQVRPHPGGLVLARPPAAALRARPRLPPLERHGAHAGRRRQDLDDHAGRRHLLVRHQAALVEKGRRPGAAVHGASGARPGARRGQAVVRVLGRGVPRLHVPKRPLCAVDLATATAENPPVVLGVWEEFKPPGELTPSTSSLVHLGSDKICVFRFFSTDRTGGSMNNGAVVIITAIDVSSDDGREIKMVKHRSKCIRFEEHLGHIRWIL